MITYTGDNYDDREREYPIDFVEKYEDPGYSLWLEKVLLKFISKNRYIDGFSAENEIRKLGVETSHIDDFCITVEDRNIRHCKPLIKDYPLNVVDPYPCSDMEIKEVNEWEIHFVAKLAKEFQKELGGIVESKDYKKFLEKLYPYKHYFLEKTWDRLSERSISAYLSFRIDREIEWYDCSEDNIAYDFNYLIWGDSKNERFLDIDTDLNNKYWENIKLLG